MMRDPHVKDFFPYPFLGASIRKKLRPSALKTVKTPWREQIKARGLLRLPLGGLQNNGVLSFPPDSARTEAILQEAGPPRARSCPTTLRAKDEKELRGLRLRPPRRGGGGPRPARGGPHGGGAPPPTEKPSPGPDAPPPDPPCTGRSGPRRRAPASPDPPRAEMEERRRSSIRGH
jgi:hypothetical protein